MSVTNTRPIPTARIAVIIEQHLVAGWTLEALASATGIDPRRLRGITRQEYPNCTFDTADRILTRLDLNDLWHAPPEQGGFSDCYQDEPPPPTPPNEEQQARAERDLRRRRERRAIRLIPNAHPPNTKEKNEDHIQSRRCCGDPGDCGGC